MQSMEDNTSHNFQIIFLDRFDKSIQKNDDLERKKGNPKI